MMEFTLSRFTLILCGAILAAAVAVPMCQMFDDESEKSMDEIARTDAETLEKMWASGFETVFIHGSDLLPSASCSLICSGNSVTVCDGGGRMYYAYTSCDLGEFTLTYGDVLEVSLQQEPAPEEETEVPEETEEELPDVFDDEPVKPVVVTNKPLNRFTVTCH